MPRKKSLSGSYGFGTFFRLPPDFRPDTAHKSRRGRTGNIIYSIKFMTFKELGTPLKILLHFVYILFIINLKLINSASVYGNMFPLMDFWQNNNNI